MLGKRKYRKSQWLPALLLCYLAGMTIWFAPSLIEQGDYIRLFSVVIIELAVIFVLRNFLRKREKQNGES